jgi:tyrosyl-tRNA synthetase
MTIDEQMAIICKGAADVISPDDLRAKLHQSERTGRPLVVKLGLDPSAPDIHLGHTVVLRKIKQLQDLGHTAALIIGDFTGRVGDPTGKSKARRQLTEDEVRVNAATYEAQLSKILDPKRSRYLFNSEWLSGLRFADVLGLASKTTVARMLERDDFHNRFAANQPIGVHELFYPLMQGYVSVALQADIELGGTDQRFNILFGRNLLADYGMERQVALLMPLLEGLDGVEKMSKSLGNYIGIHEPPGDMYGKVMSISDTMIIRWFELLTDVRPDEVARLHIAMERGELNPRDAKMRLAREITSLYHGPEAAEAAGQNFINVFQRRELPEDIPEYTLTEDIESPEGAEGADLPAVLTQAGMASSTSEARRLIAQGAVRVNGAKIDSLRMELKGGDIIQVGKRKVVRVRWQL